MVPRRVLADGGKAAKAKTAAHDADPSAETCAQAISGTSNTKKKTKNTDVATDVMLGAVPVDTEEASFLRSDRRAADQLRRGLAARSRRRHPRSSGNVATINVAITVQGTEDQVARYVAGLAALKRLFLVDNITITGAKNTDPAGNLIPPPAGRGLQRRLDHLLQMQIAGRIFSQPSAIATPPVRPSPVRAPPRPRRPPVKSGQTSPNGVQNN